MDQRALRDEIKTLLIRALHLDDKTPDDLDDDAPLFGEGLGLDSLDALELAMAIEEQYAVKLPEENDEAARAIFATIRTLADHVDRSLRGL